KEGCGFRDLHAEYEKKGAVVLGVSFDTVAENAAFVAKEKFPFAILCDTDRAIGVAYGAAPDAKADYAKRISYVIGPDGRIEQAIGSVNVTTHPKAVLDSLPSAPTK